MNSEVLSGSFLHSPRLFQLAEKLLLSQPQRIWCKNLQGSSPAFLISAVFQHNTTSQLNHLVVCEDAESAAYLHNTIENLTGALDLFYFPSSFKNKKNYRLLNSSHVMLRTEALTRLSAAMGNLAKGNLPAAGKLPLARLPMAADNRVSASVRNITWLLFRSR